MLCAGVGVNRNAGLPGCVVPEEQRGQSAESVARHFGMPAVGVEQSHPRNVPRFEEDQPVSARARMPIAQLPRKDVESLAGRL